MAIDAQVLDPGLNWPACGQMSSRVVTVLVSFVRSPFELSAHGQGVLRSAVQGPAVLFEALAASEPNEVSEWGIYPVKVRFGPQYQGFPGNRRRRHETRVQGVDSHDIASVSRFQKRGFALLAEEEEMAIDEDR